MRAAARLPQVDSVTPERAAQQLYADGHRTLSAGMPDRQLSVLITRAFRGTDTQFVCTLPQPYSIGGVALGPRCSRGITS